ncbi:DUF2330 domain-containing protein [Haliangium sp.]|uniref:DUF2330 domain-containing protein n=1 Tax=Haliangium sp. TaxID=2663208 RepID=UPI003D10D186
MTEHTHSRPLDPTRLARLIGPAIALAVVALPAAAHAFCGFYVSGAGGDMFNNATQVVLMREGKRTVLSMQNNYQGPPENFAMVVPVPMVLQEENVKTLNKEVFKRVDALAAPRLVEYWEQDPCTPQVKYDRRPMSRARRAPMAPAAESAADDLGVTVEAQFTVGEYEIVILSATNSAGLDTWLRQEKYQIPAGAEPLLRPYVQGGMKFFVAKVNVKKVRFENGQAMLSPLRFHYDSDEFALPVRLGMINSAGTQDLIVHILARGQRYEVANYPNATIPTNLNVKEEARKRFGEFYAALFDRTLDANPGAVITEYSWDASSCDPCPTPALRPDELATLGFDVLYTPMPVAKGGSSKQPKDAVDELLAQPQPRRRQARPQQQWPGGFVLTRLHARYGKGALGDDLVFKAAQPITGGREVRNGQGLLEQGSVPAGINNFQGRYAIRHEWTGPIACQNPRRGIWGGPPDGRPNNPSPALELAFAPRGKAALTTFVRGEVPGLPTKLLDVVSEEPAPAPAHQRKFAVEPPASGGAATGSGEATPPQTPAPEGASPDPAKTKTSKGCAAGGGDGGAGVGLLLLLGLALALRRRQGAHTR